MLGACDKPGSLLDACSARATCSAESTPANPAACRNLRRVAIAQPLVVHALCRELWVRRLPWSRWKNIMSCCRRAGDEDVGPEDFFKAYTMLH